ncbi:hypothetical protein P43SY_007043 [Pythium insidiosum]|uniref:VPS9 domain-containing protein n=1 Tax=Pythium insidiosum TaxID=114742 RepID=A0AAD5LDH7_PYTIN|nr:hypothetical protein P43SY_007043 [Pythium insidiosum]
MDPVRSTSSDDRDNEASAAPLSRSSFMSARDAQFWVAVAIASCSGNSSVCSSADEPGSSAGTAVDAGDPLGSAFPRSSLSAASRTSSFVMSMRASALELRASMGDGGSSSSPRSRRQSTVWTLSTNSILNDVQELDFGLLIDGEAEEEDEDEEEEAAQDEKREVRCPVTSPPAPEGGIRMPTMLHVHRLKRPGSLSPTRLSSTSPASPPLTAAAVAPPSVAGRLPLPPPPAPPLPPPSTSLLRTSALHSSEFEIAVDEIYENQRYQMVLGWGSKGHLLPLDPAKFVRVLRDPADTFLGTAATRTDWLDRRRRSLSKAVAGSPPRATAASAAATPSASVRYEHSATFPDVPLPDAPSAHERWEWISPWHLESPAVASTADKAPSPTSTSAAIDAPTDPDGWCYATSFHQFSGPSPDALASSPLSASPSINSRGRPKLYVRRRKWIRYRRLRSTSSSSASSLARASSAFDDAFLDSMRGWLWKRGHVRKNWKRRYFVLEKSVLRYYTDEGASRLKGEVLLFHPAARVHYVDVHFAADTAFPPPPPLPTAPSAASTPSSASASTASATSPGAGAASRRDLLFAVQVGPEYTLLLQAERLTDREHWMYCIEDALLCRDSYLQDPERTQDVRESVARRRRFTAHGGGLAWLRPPSAVPRPADAEAQAAQHRLWRLLRTCDALLESREMQHEIATFVAKYRQKYGSAPVSATRTRSRGLSAALLTPARMCGPDETSARTRSSSLDVEDRSSPLLSTRKNAAMSGVPEHTVCSEEESEDDDDVFSTVAALQDARSQLALKSYRFFLERMIDKVMHRLRAMRPSRWRSPPRASGVRAAAITSPRSASSVESTEDEDEDDSSRADSDDPEDDGVDWELVRRAVLFRLEQHVFVPLQAVIYALLEASVTPEDLSLFEANRSFLAAQPQSYFDIAASHESPSQWRSARLLLDSVDDYSLPSEKAAMLVQVAQCIYETFAKEHPRGSHAPAGSQLMAADDYLPIFLFVLTRSRLRNVVVTRHVVSETMVSALMIGETGYYATMLEAAVSFIASQEIARA